MLQTARDNKNDSTTLKNKLQVRFENIYLIDDDSFTLNVNKYCIEKYDFLYKNILEFQNAEEAIESLKNVDTDKNHLVLLDIDMPVMCGWEFINVTSATFSKEQLDSIFVNIVSSSSNPIDTDRAKPFLPRKFEKMLLDIDEMLSKKNT